LILVALGRLGYEDLHGVVASPESVRVANTRPGVHVNVGAFSAFPTDLGTFDCICATGVLEHFWDVDEAIRALHRLLRPEGVVYAEVPDASKYLDYYVSPYEDFSSGHINHLSFSGLRRLAARWGLETVSETSYGAPLSANLITKCAAVAWRLGEMGNLNEARDDALEARLLAFAARSARDFAEIEDVLERDLRGSSEYVLWGIGEMAFKLLALAPLTSRRAIAYVDGNQSRRGFHFDGMAVIAPTEISSSSVPVVVSSLIHADSIAAAVAKLGLENPVVRLDRWQGETSTLR
jgi:SAM-dependent methyltransferase